MEGIKTNKFLPFNKLDWFRKAASSYKVVATNGCFDILHAGHVNYLEEAKKFGHILIVGLNSDKSVREIKGENRPVNSQTDRAYVLSALSCVDYVTIFPQKTAAKFLDKVQPDTYVKGGDYSVNTINVREHNVLEKYGIAVMIVNFIEGKSTTDTIKRIKRK